jgi:hypothetical protein
LQKNNDDRKHLSTENEFVNLTNSDARHHDSQDIHTPSKEGKNEKFIKTQGNSKDIH